MKRAQSNQDLQLKHALRALEHARAEFERISYHKKADPRVLKYMDLVIAELKRRG